MKRSTRIAASTLFLLAMTLPNAAPLVSAANIPIRSVFFAADDGAVKYDKLVNWANATQRNLSELNLTIVPFQAANPDIVGSIVAPIIAPTAVLLSTSSLTIVQPTFYTQQSVFDGVSYGWWRSPIGNISNGSVVNFQLYRSDSASANVSAVSHGVPYLTFNAPENVHQVWNWTGTVSDSMPRFLGRRIAIEVNTTRAIFYNFTWLPAFAPIVPNSYYYAYWHTEGPAHAYTLFYTTNDIGNDGVYRSWLRSGTNATSYAGVDTDVSVIMQFGMSAGIAGMANFCKFWNTTCYTGLTFGWSPIVYFNMTFPHVLIGSTGGSTRYLNIVQPIYNLNKTVGVGLTWNANVYADEDAPDPVAVSGPDLVYDKTYQLFQRSVDLDTYLGGWFHGKHIRRIDFMYVFPKNDSFMYLSADPTGVGEVVTQLPCDVNPETCSQFVHTRFNLYGYFSIDPFFFENTNRNIILIPVEDPRSELGRVAAFQKWQAEMAQANAANVNCRLAATFGNFGAIEATSGNPLGLPLGVASGIAGLLIQKDCAVQGILDGLTWRLQTTYGLLKTFLQGICVLSPVCGFLWSVGSIVLTVIQFLINATEWLLFWAVKFINVFIVGIIFAIVYLSPTYIGRAIYEWVKHGYNSDILREAMRLGWERVWSLIHFLLVLVTIVVSALAAIAGIIGGLVP